MYTIDLIKFSCSKALNFSINVSSQYIKQFIWQNVVETLLVQTVNEFVDTAGMENSAITWAVNALMDVVKEPRALTVTSVYYVFYNNL